VDLIQFLTGSKVERVFAESIAVDNSAITTNDNVNITLKMKGGSLGIITYIANGDSGLSKERIEVTSGRRAAILDNFQYAYFYRKGRETKSGTAESTREFRTKWAHSSMQ